MTNFFKVVKSNFALVMTAIIVGLIVSIVAQIFALTANTIFNEIQTNNFFIIFSFFPNVNLFPLIACVTASVLICILIKIRKIDRWHGPADTIFATHQQAGKLNIKRGFESTIAAFFSISGGASVGIYGPLVHFGATLGAFLRRRTFMPPIPHDIIIGAGVAAAISAGFNSPLAGIIFSHEVVLRHFSMRALTAISLASVTANFTALEMNLIQPPLRFEEINFNMIDALPGLVLIGFISSFIAIFFIKNLVFFTKFSNQINIPFHYKPIIPGIICGIFGIFVPAAIGLGSETIVEVITSSNFIYFLILILFLKIMLTSICIGFGMFGGVFSPALFIGACTGALIFNLPLFDTSTNLHQIFAVSSMAAVAGSIIGGPITAIVLVLELTGSYNYSIASILPVSLCSLSTYIMFRSSFFDYQLRTRNISIDNGRDFILMEDTNIEKYASKKFLKFNKNIIVKNAIKKFKKNNVTEGYFTDSNDKFLGKVKLISLIENKNDDQLAFHFKEKEFIKLSPDTNINNSMKILKNFVGENIPIIDNRNNKIIGIISENDLLIAYDEITKSIREIEKN